jgi:hypothetical protein
MLEYEWVLLHDEELDPPDNAQIALARAILKTRPALFAETLTNMQVKWASLEATALELKLEEEKRKVLELQREVGAKEVVQPEEDKGTLACLALVEQLLAEGVGDEGQS